METGLQGEVSVTDRDSRRSTAGYNCNIDLIGQYQGPGAGWTSAAYKDCVYIGSTFPHTDGVQVLDVSDPAHPQPTAMLSEPAMVNGTWESLKINESRGLLAGTGVAVLLACAAAGPVTVTAEWTSRGVVPLTVHLADRTVDVGPTADPSFLGAA